MTRERRHDVWRPRGSREAPEPKLQALSPKRKGRRAKRHGDSWAIPPSLRADLLGRSQANSHPRPTSLANACVLTIWPTDARCQTSIILNRLRPPRAEIDGVERSRGRDIETTAVRSAEGDVGYAFRRLDPADQCAIGPIAVDASACAGPNIAPLIDAET